MSTGEQGRGPQGRGASASDGAAGATQQMPRGESGSGRSGVGGAPGRQGAAPSQQGQGRPAQTSGGRAAGTRTRAPRTSRSAPRRVKLTVSRVDPWSVMKISFLLSVAIGIAGVILVTIIWMLLNGMGVFADINGIITDLTQGGSGGGSFDLMDYAGFGRVVSLSIVIGVIDIILLTAIATLGAFLYNICASLVGGLQMTLSDD